MHDNNDNIVTTATNEQKTEIVLYYNETKGGVDTADQICGNYSISRICPRWPLRYFFHILYIYIYFWYQCLHYLSL